MDNLIRIGELAKICNVSHKTLRYYDQIGLLKSVLVNETNGYRYYSRWQISRVMIIKQLQALGISLAEIKLCLDNNGQEIKLDYLKDFLENKEQDINEQIKLLNKNLEKIQSLKIQQSRIEKVLMLVENSSITIEKFEIRRVIFKQYSGKYNKDIFRQYYQDLSKEMLSQGYLQSPTPSFPLAIYEENFTFENAHIKIGYELTNDPASAPNILEIPAGNYLSYIYKGTYSSLRTAAYKELAVFIKKHHYQVLGPSIEIYYLSEHLTTDQSYFITEIQIPIKSL